jgi:hypothetical protein
VECFIGLEDGNNNAVMKTDADMPTLQDDRLIVTV